MARNAIREVTLLLAFLFCPQSVRCEPAFQPDVEQEAKVILAAAGVGSGLAVHVGCEDGHLTAALRRDNHFCVHGIDVDPRNVARARHAVRTLGLHGPVSFDCFDGRRLPYADNLVNLLVSKDLGEVTQDEVLRVLAPRGVAVTKRDGKWTTAVKPQLAETDQWTHFLHGPDNNAVAQDRRVGAPRRLQWLADPAWMRNHHKLASISAIVSSAGRIFFVIDDATSADMRISGSWSLAARDAYNGLLLWKREFPDWAWHGQGFRRGPVQLPRLLVAVEDRVYVPLGMDRPVSELDAATGRTLQTYDQTKGAEELIVKDEILYVVTGDPVAEYALVGPARKGKSTSGIPRKTVIAMRRADGKLLWQWRPPEEEAYIPLTLAAASQRVVLATSQRVFCLDAETGKTDWATPARYTNAKPGERLAYGPSYTRLPEFMSPTGSAGVARSLGWSVGTLVLQPQVVLWAGTHELRALDVDDGKVLWTAPCRPGYCKSPVDVFVIGEDVWTGPDFIEARNLKTGDVTSQNSVFENLWTAGHHHRCYRNKATSRYIYTSSRGIELMDLAGDGHTRNNWVRGLCQYGILPCNGLLYVPPHACGCYVEAMMRGFMAFSSGESSLPLPAPATRLTKGDAFGNAPATAAHASDWPTFRGNPARSGATGATLSGKLERAWEAAPGGRLTQPVVSGDMLVVSSIDGYEIHALDSHTGKELWTHLTGGRVDSAPTLHDGKVYFGAADGTVTCLRASDGRLVWRYLIAPSQRSIIVRERLESVWPVRGSVLVWNDLVYAAAGRSSYIDGGITLVALDPHDGKLVHQNAFATPHPDFRETMKGKEEKEKKYPFRHFQNQYATDWKTHTDPDQSDSFSMEGSVSDILVGSGEGVYLKQVCFDKQLQRRRAGRHLYATYHYLDDSEHHRTHYVLGTGDFTQAMIGYSWLAEAHKPRAGQYVEAPYGLMLSFDQETAWGIWRKKNGIYTLFSEALRTYPESETTRRDIQWHKKEAKMRDRNWEEDVTFRPRALVRAADVLLLAGGGQTTDLTAPLNGYDEKTPGQIRIYSVKDGAESSRLQLKAAPVWEGLAVTNGRLYVATTDGRVTCFATK